MTESPALPATLPLPVLPTRLAQLTAIPEGGGVIGQAEERETHRAYRRDVQHFLRALDIISTEALRQIGRRAVIAWERMQRELFLSMQEKGYRPQTSVVVARFDVTGR